MWYFEIITDKIVQCLMMCMHTHSHTNNTDTHTYIHTGGGDWFGPKFDHMIYKHPLIKTNYTHMPICTTWILTCQTPVAVLYRVDMCVGTSDPSLLNCFSQSRGCW